MIFATTWVAAALIPTFATGLLFSWTADLIAIIALLGSARFFLALAGMHAGACQKVVKKKGDARKLCFEPVKSIRAAVPARRGRRALEGCRDLGDPRRVERRLAPAQFGERHPLHVGVVVEHGQVGGVVERLELR